jgi:hypothetical protein
MSLYDHHEPWEGQAEKLLQQDNVTKSKFVMRWISEMPSKMVKLSDVPGAEQRAS